MNVVDWEGAGKINGEDMCSDVVNPWVCMTEDLKSILEEGA